MKRVILLYALIVVTIPAIAQTTTPVADEASILKNLPWRSIGPTNMGGRVTDIAGIPGDPSTFYVAAADGGLFKTTNSGTTFKALFQDQEVLSVGAIAIAPSDANVIWLGTGEGDPRNSASFGNGVYRSTDAGETWAHLGLTDSERIKRIRVHPQNSDVAYVAALGHSWGANEERGVFKTIDGGKTWAKILYLDQDTGCSDIAIDPENPRILYAGMYTFRRRPWRFDGGGGQTALHRSTDSGETWQKLSNGLPKSPMDRIGVAIARSSPSTVYMITETKTEGVLFRSDDRGETWRAVHRDPNINFRPFYYSDIRVDPNDPERVYSLSGGLFVSSDGGRTFSRMGNGVHGDHQAFWIDPMNSNRILSGSDGGFQVSYDRGRTFEVINNVAISQYYHVTYDMQKPYNVYGGLQDNGNWVGPSATRFGDGIRKRDWFTVSGGDGFYVVPDPTSPNFVYSDSQGGNIVLTDTNTGSTQRIHPYPKEVGSSGNAIADYKYRYNWNPPIVLSPHDPKAVYYGGNVVFKTTDRGHSWEVISPDLTTNDKSKQQSSGGPVVTDNTAAEFHCTILTIAESPAQPGVIWVGTDDGNIQVTRDGGRTWTNVVGNVKGLPPNSWVPTIEASPFQAGTAYVAVDRHRDDDFGPHAFKTTDFGRTWTSIKGDLPAKGYVHVVREDPRIENLLYAGTELGIFASWDGGRQWRSIRGNMPPVAVRDLAVHPRDNDLIVGTHGRGIWILDNITPLQHLAQAMTADAYLFDIRPATRYGTSGRDGSLGQKEFTAQNPPYGALIDYYLKTEATQPVIITIADRSGKTIRTIRDGARKAGMNRVAWNLRYDGPRPAPGGQRDQGDDDDDAPGPGGPGRQAGAQAGPGAPGAAAGGPPGGGRGRFGFGGGAGPYVVPGEYTITLRVGSQQLSKSVRVDLDPRAQISEADLLAQLNASLELRDLSSTLNQVVGRIDDLTRQLTTLSETLRRGRNITPMVAAGDDDENSTGGATGRARGQAEANVQAEISGALDDLKKLRATLVREGTLNYRTPPRLREEVNSLMQSIVSPIAPPNEPQLLRLREVTDETNQAVADLNAVLATRIKAVNEKLSGVPHVLAGPPLR